MLHVAAARPRTQRDEGATKRGRHDRLTTRWREHEDRPPRERQPSTASKAPMQARPRHARRASCVPGGEGRGRSVPDRCGWSRGSADHASRSMRPNVRAVGQPRPASTEVALPPAHGALAHQMSVSGRRSATRRMARRSTGRAAPAPSANAVSRTRTKAAMAGENHCGSSARGSRPPSSGARSLRTPPRPRARRARPRREASRVPARSPSPCARPRAWITITDTLWADHVVQLPRDPCPLTAGCCAGALLAHRVEPARRVPDVPVRGRRAHARTDRCPTAAPPGKSL